VNNMPDFFVFCALLPKLMGAKIILDIHSLGAANQRVVCRSNHHCSRSGQGPCSCQAARNQSCVH
jgi:hypothetical protein